MTRSRNIQVRPERPDDHPAVFELNLRTFQRPMEAQLVERLRPVVKPLVSLVAMADQQLVGHILFTPAQIDGSHQRLAMGIGPMAVHPERQRQGIGSRLLQVGIDACRIAAIELLFVVGEPAFYQRFGFRLAEPLGLRFHHDTSPHPLLVTAIRPAMLGGLRGVVQYPPMAALRQAPTAS